MFKGWGYGVEMIYVPECGRVNGLASASVERTAYDRTQSRRRSAPSPVRISKYRLVTHCTGQVERLQLQVSAGEKDCQDLQQITVGTLLRECGGWAASRRVHTWCIHKLGSFVAFPCAINWSFVTA